MTGKRLEIDLTDAARDAVGLIVPPLAAVFLRESLETGTKETDHA